MKATLVFLVALLGKLYVQLAYLLCSTKYPNLTPGESLNHVNEDSENLVSSLVCKMRHNLPDQPQIPNTNLEREESSAPVKCALQEVWVDLDDFAKCFQ